MSDQENNQTIIENEQLNNIQVSNTESDSNEISEEQNTTTSESLMAQRFRKFFPVIVDVETAGFNPETDALLEFAAITLQFNDNGYLVPKNTYYYKIKPFEGSKFVQSNLKFTGIDPFDPNRIAFTEKEIFPSFFKSISKEVKAAGCSRAILVGHNAHFDHSFLKAVTNRLSYKRSPFHPFSVIDTASLSALTLGQTVMGISCLVAGIDFDENKAHNALYDTQKEAELFCFSINRYKDLGGWPLPNYMQENSSTIAAEYKTRFAK
jgi:ribonuclease T